eukprot:CAMPEP_0115419740 /NCGR_PEP_ID=MMETSP0271-20121206/25356_1 /TAXON_ID=71861 /ORGANISM="Scrippsiella trochoidea, Strain CCMP3099" /LENGTH=173 /DNA_ID=CAMNT_0002844289 /DNA_START=78 /DNA_END=596 /DNA_ORIENTATION=+
MASRSDRTRAALDKLDAAMNGESRLSQYVVEPAEKIIEEVSEEQYRCIVEKRREDFVVDDKGLGYEDSGKELWEGDERAKEQRLAAAAADKAAKAAAAAKCASPQQPSTAAAAQKVAPAGASLQKMFQAGARTSGVSEPAAAVGGPAKDSHKQKELDDMLQQMCGELEAGGGA